MAKAKQKPTRREIRRRRTTARNFRKRRETAMGRLGEEAPARRPISAGASYGSRSRTGWKRRPRSAAPCRRICAITACVIASALNGCSPATSRTSRRRLTRDGTGPLRPRPQASRRSWRACQKASASSCSRRSRECCRSTDNEAPAPTTQKARPAAADDAPPAAEAVKQGGPPVHAGGPVVQIGPPMCTPPGI
jgi:hypothetical protein